MKDDYVVALLRYSMYAMIVGGIFSIPERLFKYESVFLKLLAWICLIIAMICLIVLYILNKLEERRERNE